VNQTLINDIVRVFERYVESQLCRTKPARPKMTSNVDIKPWRSSQRPK